MSTSVAQADPYKFNVNYSEAGQRLARKAQEQLKTAEKVKEIGTATSVLAEATKAVAVALVSNSSASNSNRGSRRNSTEAFNDGSEFGEDWQYVRTLIYILIRKIFIY